MALTAFSGGDDRIDKSAVGGVAPVASSTSGIPTRTRPTEILQSETLSTGCREHPLQRPLDFCRGFCCSKLWKAADQRLLSSSASEPENSAFP